MIRHWITVFILMISGFISTVSCGEFRLIDADRPLSLLYDDAEPSVVRQAVSMFSIDLVKVCGTAPRRVGMPDGRTVIAGTLGKSSILDNLMKSENVWSDDIRGK